MQYGSNVGRDLYVVVGDVRKACLHIVVVGMVIPCSFSAGSTLVCFFNHHLTESKISLCVQIPGHWGQPLICDKSHFALLAIFCVLRQDPQHERVVVVVYLSVHVTCWLLGGPFSNTLPLHRRLGTTWIPC